MYDLIKSDYAKSRSVLGDVLSELRPLIEATLVAEKLDYLFISGRVKSEESFYQKFLRPDRSYTNFNDVTDLIGLRIVTSFEDTIPGIAGVIEKTFSIDLFNSHNKLVYSDFQKFGYRSLHYVCHLPPALKFKFGLELDFKFEVQIRTSLQNAWAEIEHGLGYKSDKVADSKLRRRFSRLSSLFEIADEELVQIRHDLTSYKVHQSEVFDQTDHPLDTLTIETLIESDLCSGLDRRIEKLTGIPLGTDYFHKDYLLLVLSSIGCRDVRSLIQLIQNHRASFEVFVPVYLEFAKKVLNFDVSSLKSLSKGYAILFLAHMDLSASHQLTLNRAEALEKFYFAIDFPNDPKKARQVAHDFVQLTEGFFRSAKV